MFDVGQILVTILSHPAMAEVTALAGIAVSVAQSRKPRIHSRKRSHNIKKIVSFPVYLM
jgi:hypothetical protein